MFMIDGILWDVPCDIEQAPDVRTSEISGLMLDGSYFNDVIGTYLNYSVKMVVPLDRRNDFYVVYNKVIEPVDGHVCSFPFENSIISITARITNIKKIWVRLAGGANYWKGITFNVVANHPSLSLSLSEVITRGRAPLPDVAQPAEGATYTYTNGQWVPAQTYADADLIAY